MPTARQLCHVRGSPREHGTEASWGKDDEVGGRWPTEEEEEDEEAGTSQRADCAPAAIASSSQDSGFRVAANQGSRRSGCDSAEATREATGDYGP